MLNGGGKGECLVALVLTPLCVIDREKEGEYGVFSEAVRKREGGGIRRVFSGAGADFTMVVNASPVICCV